MEAWSSTDFDLGLKYLGFGRETVVLFRAYTAKSVKSETSLEGLWALNPKAEGSEKIRSWAWHVYVEAMQKLWLQLQKSISRVTIVIITVLVAEIRAAKVPWAWLRFAHLGPLSLNSFSNPDCRLQEQPLSHACLPETGKKTPILSSGIQIMES